MTLAKAALRKLRASVDPKWLVALSALVLALGSQSMAQTNWLSRVREELAANDLQGAADTVDARLESNPADLEAQAWRARILSWTGHLQESELRYRDVLRQVPNDADVLLGLADVLLWERKLQECSEVLDHIQQLPHAEVDLEERRLRLRSARDVQGSPVVVHGVGSSRTEIRSDSYRYYLNIGTESDLFSYGSAAQLQISALLVNWNSRWSSQFSGTSYRRLGQSAEYFSTSSTYRFTDRESIAVSFGQGSHQQIAPVRQISVDWDGGTKHRFGLVKGIELVGHSAAIWFVGSQVVVLGGSTIAYFPRDWRWILIADGAQTKFDRLSPSWAPSFSTKLSAPVSKRLRVDMGYGIGAENYSNVDQIGRISARTCTGATHYSVTATQEFSVFLAYQRRSQGITQMSVGGGYGIHF